MKDTLRAIIVDDERLALAEMRTLLAAHPEVDVMGEAANLAQAAVLLRDTCPDVVFLDINLGHRSGFELACPPASLPTSGTGEGRHLTEEVHIIFVTGYAEYAIRAFEVNALDYLLKPVRPERLAAALRRVHGHGPRYGADVVHSAGDGGQISPDQISPGQIGPKQMGPGVPLGLNDVVMLRTGRGFRFVPVADIRYIAAADDYTSVHATDGTSGLADISLSEWEKRLPSREFLRIHRATLVHLRYVSAMEPGPGSNYRLHLRGTDETLTISRRYAAKTKKLFGL